MKKIFLSLLCYGISSNLFAQDLINIKKVHQDILFDTGWRFHRGNIADAEQPGFDDNNWRKVDLPHDWSIEDLPGTDSPFDPNAVNGVSVGFTIGGTGWYRKTFRIPLNEKNKRVIIQFDGIYMNPDVWLNGTHLGNHPYGYTTFYYDITDKMKWNEKNVIAVQVKNEGATSRWYAGSGINRHVWLKMVEPVHIAQWGTYITTPEVSSISGTVNIKTIVQNETGVSSAVTLNTQILDPSGHEVARTTAKKTIEENGEYDFEENTILKTPALWSDLHPNLYRAVSEIFLDGKLSDHIETIFGIRKISIDAKNGFMLNGLAMKLKGACYHNDNGPLGSRSFDRAEIRRVELLKASGFNAIRCSHNPPPPAFLNACDKLGMLVIDEAFDCWNNGKNENDYHLYFKDWWQKDIQSMVLRDRNHPSIIMWSIGNELPFMGSPGVNDTAKILADYVRSIEPTRPVTAAVNSVSEKMDGFFSALDVCGYNYARDSYETDHQRKPDRIMFATESYALTAFDYWMSVVDHPWVIGDFVWTGFDYIGEASIGWRGYEQEKNFYPWNLAFCGDIDICGWKRPQSFYRDGLWKKDQLSIFVKPLQPSFPVNPKKRDWSIWNWDDVVADWNWKGKEDSIFEVNVYSSCEAIELFLNNKSLGKKSTKRSTKFMEVWQVPYAAGELKAIGYTGSKKIATSILRTADSPAQIKLSADRKKIKADGEDLCYITVELLDAKGVKNPKAENLVQFTIEGPGEIVGVGNANPMSVESYQQPQRKAWQGRCIVVVKTTNKPGKIILKANAEGLKPAAIAIDSW